MVRSQRGAICAAAIGTLIIWTIDASTEFSSSPVVRLSRESFEHGTFRITAPGTYVLQEDIEFGPQAPHDYWPQMSDWDKYPPAAYFLGFFAAMTVEADDVTIDLNGFEIRQAKEFYLVQRFYNHIELNNRLFVPNEGVSSLNYQATDKAAGRPVGPLITPTNVVIKNGSLGQSSHAGIHGNSVNGLTVANIHVHGFEVAGIQCNGCKNVSISDCEVGPGALNVPVLATFSNSRFFERFSHTVIPQGFAREAKRDQLLSLLDEKIGFADRDDEVTLNAVFERNRKAVVLFRRFFLGEDMSELSETDAKVLEDAKLVFTNRFGKPDGSAQYGIFLNRRGLPQTDENFLGAGRESSSVVISNVNIHGLSAHPIEVPSLMTEEGSHMQGPARDLLRIDNIVTDRMRTLLDSRYKGTFLSDMYFAMWKLSNSFYRVRVFDSDCGNFGSNASMPYNLYSFPSDGEPTCADLGNSQDPQLTGRDVTMLQKRYFGGLQLSQAVYDWATTHGAGLDGLLTRPSRPDLQRAGYRHKIVCDYDTMFHPMHGVAGLKLVELEDAVIENVQVQDLKNSGDKETWTCRPENKWRMQPSDEEIQTITAASNGAQSAMIRGVELVRCNSILFRNVSVTELSSDEGSSWGFDITGDSKDRSDHDDDAGLIFENVRVDMLSGTDSMALRTSGTPLDTSRSGITIGKPEEVDASLGAPRMTMNYQMTNARSPRKPGESIPALVFTSEEVLISLKSTTTLDTDEKIREHRTRVLAFYRQHYGMVFAENVDEARLLDPITVYTQDGSPTTSVVQLGQLALETEYHATSICTASGDSSQSVCSDAETGLVHDFAWNFLPGREGYILHGAFGGDAGKLCPENNIVWVGLYSFERVSLPGVNEGANLQVEYYGECPTPLVKFYGDAVGFYINCAVESDMFGKGMASGSYIFEPSEDGTEWILNGYPSMMFDDQVVAPVKSPVETFIFDDVLDTIETNEWRFSFIADGKLPTRLSGEEAVPFGHAYHFTHEAGILFLQRRTSYKTEDKIRALRKRFVTRLRDTFGIELTPSDYDGIPLDGVIDLGGGNKIMAYVVNEDANQRVVTKRGFNGTKTATMPRGSRLHEGGFRYVVGRAGIVTADGRIPFGSIFQEGLYILEDSSARELEIEFYSNGPSMLNGWSTTVAYQNLFHPVLGDGKMYALYPFPVRRPDGIELLNRGALVFGNLESPAGLPTVQ